MRFNSQTTDLLVTSPAFTLLVSLKRTCSCSRLPRSLARDGPILNSILRPSMNDCLLTERGCLFSVLICFSFVCVGLTSGGERGRISSQRGRSGERCLNDGVWLRASVRHRRHVGLCLFLALLGRSARFEDACELERAQLPQVAEDVYHHADLWACVSGKARRGYEMSLTP